MRKQVMEYADAQRQRSKATRRFLKDYADEIMRVNRGLEVLDKWFIHGEVDAPQESIDISYSGDKHLLQGIFSAFRKLGYTPGRRPEDKPLASFTTYWDHPTLKIRFYVTFSSTVCKRVKVGEKQIMQPIFETVCE